MLLPNDSPFECCLSECEQAMTSPLSARKADLSSVLVRIDRAKTHLNEFDNQVRPISAACQMTRECDEQRSEYIFRLSKVPTVPPVLSAIIGDAIHNLRVSLDYLAWQLVIATGQNPPNKETFFPVRKMSPKADQGGCIYPDIAPGVSMAVRKILDDVQPYKRSKSANHELAVLHNLDINDKHHELLVAIIGVKDNIISWFGDDADPIAFNDGPYNDGSEVYRFKYSGTGREFSPSARFTVRLNEPAAGPWGHMRGAADLVRRSLGYIEKEVLPRFEAFF
jgi:hypothetical protein